MVRRARIGTVLLAAALLVGACGDDDAGGSDVTVPADPNSSTSSSTTSSSTTTADPAGAVEQAFYDQWDAFVEITSAPDVDNPLIDEYFTGEAKQALLDGVSKLIADGQAIRLPEDPSDFEPRIVEIRMEGESSAVVYECTVEALVIVDQATGEVVDDAVSEFESRNVFERVDGRFKVSETADPPEGEPGCDDL